MSMTGLRILQFIGMFTAYTGITLLLPAILFRRILRGRKLSQQFLLCYTFGNFYIINIVFFVQLLHISNFFTLTVLTVLLSVGTGCYVNQISLHRKIRAAADVNRKAIQGKLGFKTIADKVWKKISCRLKRLAGIVYRTVICRPLQWSFVCLVLFCLFWIYGRQLFLVYGYRASDIPVHMNWINQMSRGNLFASGVYPFGYHCIIYYLHTVFRMDVYVLMSEFFFVQVIYAHLVILAVLKLLCRAKYTPYAGMLVYILGNFWAAQTYSRYYSTLPQEFGMIFVYPSIYFLIAFFQIRKEKLKEKETLYILAGFAMAFSLTLAIHFYGTMIAGLCCVGIAFGFFFRFFRKEYFCRIMVTGIISVFLAVLPMGIAFATGTPLQGSLGWGMSVINGGKDSSEDKNDTDEKASEQDSTDESSAGSSTTENDTAASGNATSNGTTADGNTADSGTVSADNGNTDNSNTDGGNTDSGSAGSSGSTGNTIPETVKKPTIKDRIRNLPETGKSLIRMMADRINEYIVSTDVEAAGFLILAMIGILFPLGVIFCIFRKMEYGAALMSVSFCMGIITLLLCSGNLGLPTLMDAARCSIYYAYLLAMVPVLIVDAAGYLIFMPEWMQLPGNVVSLGASLVMAGGLLQPGMIKEPVFQSDFVTNEAITCLSNIIHDNQDYTWTIVSANDETQMGLDHGWHYETISFLREMEHLSDKTEITIPTKEVYIFIEKIPLNYAIAYSESGQSVSVKGAEQALPNVGGIGMYQGERRWIVMSRMYEWAKAFRQKYPNEMQIYYETDRFICYKIEQNTYHLYNFAIDYGYNQVVTEETEK